MSRRMLIPMLLVVSMLIGLVGCGGGKGTIKIGLQGPMTGDYAYEGKGFRQAVELLVEQTNAAGGSTAKRSS